MGLYGVIVGSYDAVLHACVHVLQHVHASKQSCTPLDDLNVVIEEVLQVMVYHSLHSACMHAPIAPCAPLLPSFRRVFRGSRRSNGAIWGV